MSNLDYVAIVIAVSSAVFAGIIAKLAFREQKERLRPRVFVDTIDTLFSKKSITWTLNITNIGFLPAKNVVIAPTLSVDGISKGVNKEEEPSKALILPKQIFHSRVGIKDATMQQVMQEKVTLKMKVKINYKGNRKSQTYYYRANYCFNARKQVWVFEEGDAN